MEAFLARRLANVCRNRQKLRYNVMECPGVGEGDPSAADIPGAIPVVTALIASSGPDCYKCGCSFLQFPGHGMIPAARLIAAFFVSPLALA